MFVKYHINLLLRDKSNQTINQVKFKLELYTSPIDFSSTELELSSNKNESSPNFEFFFLRGVRIQPSRL